MTLTEYQVKAERTIPKDMLWTDRLQHACFGLASETGEVMGLFQKTYQGHPIDRDRLLHELGDVIWFSADIMGCFDIGFEEVAGKAILKADWPKDVSFIKASFGVMSKLSLIVELMDRSYPQYDIDRLLIMKRLTEFFTSLIELLKCFRLGLSEVMDANIAKLEKRYPIEEGFTAYRSLHRQEGDL